VLDHQVLDQAVLQREELTCSVRGLAEPDHPGIPDEFVEGVEIGKAVPRCDGAQRVGCAPHPLQHGGVPGHGGIISSATATR
jgi:hypothetical protein